MGKQPVDKHETGQAEKREKRSEGDFSLGQMEG